MNNLQRGEMMMKARPFLLALLVLAAFSLFLCRPAFCQSGHEGPPQCNKIKTQPHAPGIVWHGTLALHYEQDDPSDVVGVFPVHWFARLVHFKRHFAFSGTFMGNFQDLCGTQESLETAVRDVMIPVMYKCTAGVNCPPFALRRAYNIAWPDDLPLFEMLDLALAVDK